MGSGQSGARKASFSMDEDERVQVLRGVKLSEDVLQRMRGGSTERSGATPPTPHPQAKTPPSPTATESREEMRRRYEREQARVQEELSRVARRERDAARQDLSRAVQRERQQTRQEGERAKQLSRQLEKKEVELKALDAFYREQLVQLEKRNLDQFQSSQEQFHAAAARSEAQVKPRSTAPVCSSLQARILSCYRENRDQTLRCSELAREYQQCIDQAKKVPLPSPFCFFSSLIPPCSLHSFF
ncbi:MICOS complex subunit mic25a-like isoform X2 [Denticeps clupeoides]|uniref:MICOS complex subunit mic25a-like isoform X2 n=1 Tax=Denticeps clupeoides TaxID=299321 RepID=UPI0010A36031|nr:MICOS complex subunit mic25a-like isoform X2 [Denticeps clupeoides]